MNESSADSRRVRIVPAFVEDASAAVLGLTGRLEVAAL